MPGLQNRTVCVVGESSGILQDTPARGAAEGSGLLCSHPWWGALLGLVPRCCRFSVSDGDSQIRRSVMVTVRG